MIRSAVAGLLDRPDPAGRRVAELEHGDEVEVFEIEDLWTNVLTPTGLAGWLPIVVLTEATGAAAGSAIDAVLAAGLDPRLDHALDARPEGPSIPATPTDEPLDLVAYLEAHRRTDTHPGRSGVG